MRLFAVAGMALTALIFAAPAGAQQYGGEPACSVIRNLSDFTLYGDVRTDRTPTADGTLASHEKTFRLKAGEEVQVCSTGPFFEGGTVELTLRTLIPVFTCRTQLGAPIDLTVTPKTDGDGYNYAATCRGG